MICLVAPSCLLDLKGYLVHNTPVIYVMKYETIGRYLITWRTINLQVYGILDVKQTVVNLNRDVLVSSIWWM